MNDILARILEIITTGDNLLKNKTFNRAKLASIADLVKAEIESEAACRNTMLDYKFMDDDDKRGNWVFRFRERLACWIAP